MIGRTVSHYEIIEKLGEGGMGVVYKARDTKLDRTVALKFLPQHVGVNADEKQRFINEAKAASALDHNNICNIHSIEETDDKQIFIVMAHYEGMSLHEKIKQGPLPLIDITKYAIQISEGLRKAHERGIVHRDLKPANIFITTDEQVKIIDFGLAKATVQTMLTKTGTTLGTAPYMSPEQAQGAKVDHRTDIWSLGVVIYEMITGQRPFKSEYETALVYSIINEDPDPVTGLRSGVPMELERIVQKCLEKDPSERYQNTGDSIVDLKKVEKTIASGIQSKVSSPTITKEDHHADTVPHLKKMKPMVYGIPVLLAILIGVLYFISGKDTITELTRSVAVLPLENLSPDPDDAYFTAGIHEDIIIQLSRIGDLQVIARSSVMGYPAGERNIKTISSELGVQSILEGSVRRVANRVRVAVTLTDVHTNRTLWADSFDRDLTDIFAIQSEIAIEIANALEARLTEMEIRQLDVKPTSVTEAYEYYLRAREYFRKPGFQLDDFRHAETLLQRAIEYDPEFAHAYALLSLTYSYMRWFGLAASPHILTASLENAERAFQLHPDLPEAHIARGYYYYYGHRDYDNALEHFNIARRHQPNNADIISAIGFVERRLGRFEDAIVSLNRAVSLDPRNLSLLFSNGQSYMAIGRYEEARSIFEKAISFAPDLIVLRIFLSLNDILWKGDTESTRSFLQDYSHLKRDSVGDWLRMQYIIGDFEGMIQAVHDVPRDMYRGQLYLYLPSFIIGLANDHLGNHEQARLHYEKALEEYTNFPLTYLDDPRYRISLGRTFAGLGKKQQALEQGEIAFELVTQLDDALDATALKADVALIYAKLQKPDKATEILRDVLSAPGYQSVHRMRIDPAWDVIRNTSEFQQLLQEFEEKV